MGKLVGGVVILSLAVGCKVQQPSDGTATAAPQASMFCSSAYPNGIAQEDPSAPPELILELKATGFENVAMFGQTDFLFDLAMPTGELGSGTIWSLVADGQTPVLIVEMVAREYEGRWGLNLTTYGREDNRAGVPQTGPADARILFTYSVDGYTSAPSVLSEAVTQFALLVIGGWTCSGDTAVPTRSFP